MAKTPIQTRELKDQASNMGDKTASTDQAVAPLISGSSTPTGDQFYTEIVGRAPIRDLSKIPSPKMGIERIDHNVDSILLENEAGPNGEPVYGLKDDPLDRVRFVGGSIENIAGRAYGRRIAVTTSGNDYVEITFYGTGLNLLTQIVTAANRGGDVYFDGVYDSALNTTGSDVLLNAGFGPYHRHNVVSGKDLGIHTVKIEVTASTMSFGGFEILNESTTIDIPANSAILAGEDKHLIPSTNLGYSLASDFDATSDSPAGGKGGAVSVYSERQADGSIEVKQRFKAVDATQHNLGLADHANEEVIKRINWRQFGAGTVDDFSTLDGATNDKAFTLDDGTTTLIGNDVDASGVFGPGVRLGTGGSGIAITFVGTGLDITGYLDSAAAQDTHTIEVDGASIGNLIGLTATNSAHKIVSGLPYGTHIVQIPLTSVGSVRLSINDFIIYGPKKPSIPEGAGMLGSYYKMADFDPNTTSTVRAISAGVLRKVGSREAIYENGTGGTSNWSIVKSVGRISGYELQSDRLNSKLSYTFFGTGFDYRFTSHTNRSTDVRVSLNGTSLTASNFPTASFSTNGTGISYDSVTNGSLDMNDAATEIGCGFQVRGLPLGTFTIEFDNNVASSFVLSDALDIITPIHSYESSAELLHDRLVGSNSMRAETGLPNFYKEKQSFPQGVDLGASKTKWQEKILEGNIISDGDFLFFHNLTIGKTYRLYAQVYLHSDTGGGIDCDVNHDGVQIAGTGYNPSAADVGSIIKSSINVVFVAKATSVSLGASSASSSEYIGGNDTKDNTWARLEELPNHIETDEW